jgi:hypothetical protein
LTADNLDIPDQSGGFRLLLIRDIRGSDPGNGESGSQAAAQRHDEFGSAGGGAGFGKIVG